jgi:hypothetical protein
MGRLETGRSGTGRSRKKLQQTFLLLTGFRVCLHFVNINNDLFTFEKMIKV